MNKPIRIDLQPQQIREIALYLHAARRYYWEQGPRGESLGDRAMELAHVFEKIAEQAGE